MLGFATNKATKMPAQKESKRMARNRADLSGKSLDLSSAALPPQTVAHEPRLVAILAPVSRLGPTTVSFGVGLVALALAVPSAFASGGCPNSPVPSTGTESQIDGLITAVRRAVPLVYSGMTNQSGRGAWRGYRILRLVSLGPDAPHNATYTRLRKAAVSRCGRSAADATWSVSLQFPLAQTIPDSKSTAYFVHGKGGWRFWFQTP
jgi:hypothetical protein